ncbi:uncharacterized protein K441DRAFT_564887, partial [Cenococcum geophilum 1.58]|uniref:uncharacterized protein n=1 Tax=Cenococcum geophilum 1.58 TaxID=794803 RepID=UPI00358FE5C4
NNSTIYTPVTPSKSVTIGFKNDRNRFKPVKPSSGSTIIIRSVLSGDIITLSDGQITLSNCNNHGSNKWLCVKDSNK